MLKNRMYKCPICNKAMVELNNEAIDEEIRSVPMPQEYRNLQVRILCNECNEKSTTAFHVFGLKCAKCSSYNTVRIMENQANDNVIEANGNVTEANNDEDSWDTIGSDEEDVPDHEQQ
jgi:Zn finger protein HypA/HybF involved in hydrogenase expression